MTRDKKLSEASIKHILLEDAANDDAWERPISVAPASSPRPGFYGRSRHLELAATFHVLSLLHRMGAEANLTFAQPDDVDIVAVRKSGEVFTIDVKTLAGTTMWRVEQFPARKHHFIAFICFRRESTDPHLPPKVFIWSSEILKGFVRRNRETSISLEAVASQFDPAAAWQEFKTEPAA